MHTVEAVADRESAIIGLFRPCTFFSTKVRQSDVTEFHQKLDILMIWKGFSKFAQWVRGPKLVLYKWVLAKSTNFVMKIRHFLHFFKSLLIMV